MPLATATITGKTTDLLGGAAVRVKVILTPVSSRTGILPADANLRFGPLERDSASDGTITLTGVPKLPQTGYEDWRWQVTIDPLYSKRPAQSFVFSLTGDTTWGAIAAADTSGVAITPSLLQQVQDALAAAITAQHAAEAARDAAIAAAGGTGSTGGGTGGGTGASSITTADNDDGTVTLTAGTGAVVTDNDDGTVTVTPASGSTSTATDNNDGTATIAA